MVLLYINKLAPILPPKRTYKMTKATIKAACRVRTLAFMLPNVQTQPNTNTNYQINTNIQIISLQ